MDDLTYIKNRDSDTLYIVNNGWIKYHNYIIEEKTLEDSEFQVSSKIKITLCLSNWGKVRSFQIVKYNWDEKDGEIRFTTFTLERIVGFIHFLTDNISSLKEWEISMSEIEWKDVSISKWQIERFLETEEGQNIIKEILNNKTTKEDIINIGYRKEQLEIFRKLLTEELGLEIYRDDEYKSNLELCKKYWLTNKSIWEKIWQYFFQKNNWIFWYWLDYRFMWIIQREADLSTKTVWSRESVNWDFLVWDNNYVHFVELKLPNTPIFWKDKNRSNSWCLSDELFNAKSQILEHKASWLVKLHQKHSEEDKNYKKINWKSYDSKVILIIWDIDNELEKSWDEEWIKEIKRKTFELFRNDSNNIEIITYKELYDRSEFLLKLKEY